MFSVSAESQKLKNIVSVQWTEIKL